MRAEAERVRARNRGGGTDGKGVASARSGEDLMRVSLVYRISHQ